MNPDDGKIYDITEEAKKGMKKGEIENLVPFEVNELVELKGCKFRVRSIFPHPINVVTMEGIPKVKGGIKNEDRTFGG